MYIGIAVDQQYLQVVSTIPSLFTSAGLADNWRDAWNFHNHRPPYVLGVFEWPLWNGM